jgi:hypothetical protein
MNWDAIGAIAETLGALGVIATLVYLTSQIRQNTQALQRAEMNTAFSQFSDYRKLLLSNPIFLEILRKGQIDLSSLNESENEVFEMLTSEIFHIFRFQFDRVLEGLIDMDDWLGGTRPFVLEALSHAGTKEWWETNKVLYPARFVNELDGA